MIIRQIAGPQKILYLTFDDGPRPSGTPEVLQLLEQKKVRGTFFLVAARAQAQPELVQSIIRQGHAIGNHSLDHRYGVFFQGTAAMKSWIQQAELVFDQMGLPPRVGFRPPNGILTPKVFQAVRELQMPLILWNTRFYDSLWTWTRAKAMKALATIEPGSIVLLHDVQRPANQATFLETLSLFIDEARRLGFEFEVLPAAP